MALLEMAEKAGERHFLRHLVRRALQQLIVAPADAHGAAGRHERSGDRLDQRARARQRGNQAPKRSAALTPSGRNRGRQPERFERSPW